MEYSKLVLLRHGQSIFNKRNLFTGWTDVDLSDQGIVEARQAGMHLKEKELYPDICFASWLKRSIHTAQIAMKALRCPKYKKIDPALLPRSESLFVTRIVDGDRGIESGADC